MLRSVIPLLLLGFVGSANAQVTGLGFKVGPSMSMTYVSAMNNQLTPGATAGFYMPMLASSRLEIQLEVLGSMQGNRHVDPEGNSEVTKLYYLQLPLSGKFFFSNVINVQFGGQYGKLVKAENMARSGDKDVTAHFNDYDLGLNIGAGVDLINGLDMTFRAYRGLSPILANDQVLYPVNRMYQFTVGYRFAKFNSLLEQRRR